MATRRSKLLIKPNIGPKLGKGGPVKSGVNIADKKTSLDVLKDKPVDIKKTKSEPKLHGCKNKIEKPSSSPDLTVIKAPPVHVDIELVKIPSPLKSPNSADKKTKPIFKPDAGLARGVRNRLPKAKPNIAPRGLPNTPTSKVIATTKITSTEKSPIQVPQKESLELSNNAESPLVDKDVQDENIPVSIVEDTQLVATETSRDTQTLSVGERKSSIAQQKTEKDKTHVKRHRGNSYRKFPENEPPDRQKMKMSDLIYWNPSNNPMKQSINKVKKNIGEISPVKSIESVNTSSPVKDVDDSSMCSSNDSMPVPQVIIGPDGSMIINEQSLVIETEKEKSEIPMQNEVVEDDDMFVNYNSFRNKGPTKSWFDNETARFYRALSALGTDFSLMSSLFPHRSRRELKNKFKREEKYNRNLVDAAIGKRAPLNLESFESIESVLEKDRMEREKRKKDAIKRKKEEKQPRNSEPKSKKPKLIKESNNHKKTDEYVSDTECNPKRPKPPKRQKANSDELRYKTPEKHNKEQNDLEPLTRIRSKASKPLQYSEFDFESGGEEEPLPARLPKLQKSERFKEFKNTAAKKLHQVILSQPVSEDDDDDNEEDDVDVLDSENEDEEQTSETNMEGNVNKINISNNDRDSSPLNIETTETPVPINTDIPVTVINTQDTLLSDASPTNPTDSQNKETETTPASPVEPTGLSQKSLPISTTKNINEIKDSQQMEVTEESPDAELLITEKQCLSVPITEKHLQKSEKIAASFPKFVSRRKKFQPNLGVQRKKNPNMTKIASESENSTRPPMDKPLDAVKSTVNAEDGSMSPRIPVMETFKSSNTTEAEKLQVLCESQPVSEDEDDDNEDDEVEVVDCDNFNEDTAPVVIVKTEVIEPSNNILDTEISNMDGSVVNATSNVHQNVMSPNTQRIIKNKSKTIPISKRQLSGTVESSNAAANVCEVVNGSDNQSMNTSLISENVPHFVLPANVFPNLPFTHNEDQMQMVLVPETKDGNTIYHVYMLPDNENSKSTETLVDSNTDKIDTIS